MEDERFPRATARAARATIVASLLALPIVVLDTGVHLHGTADAVVHAANWALWAVFAAALITLLASRGVRAGLAAHPGLVVVVLLSTPIAPPALQLSRLLRLLPLLRLFGVAHLAARALSLDGLRFAAVLLAIAVFGGGALLPVLEPALHLSSGDGIWWAIETVTTVGYGDIVPHSAAGRVLGVTIMVIGIGTAALLIGAAAQRFTSGDEKTPDDVTGRLDRLTAEIAELRAHIEGSDPVG